LPYVDYCTAKSIATYSCFIEIFVFNRKYWYTKNDFAKLSKNLAKDLKIILLDHQNNYVENLSVDDYAVKSFDTLATSLSALQNYFDGPTKLFLDLAKFLDTFAKLFFPCHMNMCNKYVEQICGTNMWNEYVFFREFQIFNYLLNCI